MSREERKKKENERRNKSRLEREATNKWYIHINESNITNIEQCAYQRHPPQKIESSLYQDFHVLYVHISRDKKAAKEGNESEKLSQFPQAFFQFVILYVL